MTLWQGGDAPDFLKDQLQCLIILFSQITCLCKCPSRASTSANDPMIFDLTCSVPIQCFWTDEASDLAFYSSPSAELSAVKVIRYGILPLSFPAVQLTSPTSVVSLLVRSWQRLERESKVRRNQRHLTEMKSLSKVQFRRRAHTRGIYPHHSIPH